MAFDCDPCTCPEQHYRHEHTWRKAIITLLCRLRETISNCCQQIGTEELIATGTTFADAAQITEKVCRVIGDTACETIGEDYFCPGVKLPANVPIGDIYYVYNHTADELFVYPGSLTEEFLFADGSVSPGWNFYPAYWAIFTKFNATQWLIGFAAAA